MGRDARHNPHSRESAVRLSPTCYDQSGFPLGEGCRVLLTQPLQARVVKIAPVMDPKLPQNFLMVEIHSISRVLTPAEAPIQHVFRLAEPTSASEPAEPPADGPKLVEP